MRPGQLGRFRFLRVMITELVVSTLRAWAMVQFAIPSICLHCIHCLFLVSKSYHHSWHAPLTVEGTRRSRTLHPTRPRLARAASSTVRSKKKADSVTLPQRSKSFPKIYWASTFWAVGSSFIVTSLPGTKTSDIPCIVNAGDCARRPRCHHTPCIVNGGDCARISICHHTPSLGS